MPRDTVTLELQGKVSLARFADAVGRFSSLVEELASAHGATGIRWEIADLEAGSATATARGLTGNGATASQLERVVDSYLEVGEALQRGATLPFPPPVEREARALASVIGGGVEGIRFETAKADVLLREPAADATVTPASEPVSAYGAVTGRVQTLTSRSRLRFTLYDTLADRAVSCYLAEGKESEARDIWDRLATVEGWVSRDPASGRPLTVRRITAVNVLDEGETGGYRRARGVLARRGASARAEERIRRLRDAW